VVKNTPDSHPEAVRARLRAGGLHDKAAATRVNSAGQGSGREENADMYARVSTWCANPEDFSVLDREVANTVTQIKQQAGYIRGFEIQVASDTRMIVSFWRNEREMTEAFDASAAVIRSLMESGRLTLVDVKTGPVEEWV
jgi:heme-degrading monooxygenase HmoA